MDCGHLGDELDYTLRNEIYTMEMDHRHKDIVVRKLEIDSKHLEIDPRIMRRVPVHGDALKPPGDRL